MNNNSPHALSTNPVLSDVNAKCSFCKIQLGVQKKQCELDASAANSE